MAIMQSTLEKTDFDQITPQRLADTIDYRPLCECSEISHRGHEVSADQLTGQLGAALDHAAIEAGEETAPSNLRETAAVDVVLEALERQVPRWFGHDAALENYDHPVAEDHLDRSDLQEAYWNGEIVPETMPVAGGSWADQKRVILPLLALVWERLTEQMQADQVAVVEAGKTDIKKTVVQAVKQQGLTGGDVATAVDEAFEQISRSSRE